MVATSAYALDDEVPLPASRALCLAAVLWRKLSICDVTVAFFTR